MLGYSFPQPHSPISYACKPEIFYEGWKLAAEILKSGMKMLMFAVLLKKRPVEPQVYNGTQAAVRPWCVFYLKPLAL